MIYLDGVINIDIWETISGRYECCANFYVPVLLYSFIILVGVFSLSASEVSATFSGIVFSFVI